MKAPAKSRERAAKKQRVLRDGPDLTGPELEDRLEATWARPKGLVGWLGTRRP